jgi:hypothetical protein
MTQNPFTPPSADSEVAPALDADDEDYPIHPRLIALVGETRPWVLVIAIVLVVGCGFMVLGGFGLMVMSLSGSAFGETPVPFGWALSLAYLALSAIYVAPIIYLFRFAGAAERLKRGSSSRALEDALRSNKSFWKYSALMMLGFIAVYFIAILVMIATNLPGLAK